MLTALFLYLLLLVQEPKIEYEPKPTIQLEIHRPEHPDARKIREYLHGYPATGDVDDYVVNLIYVSRIYHVDPKLIAAIYVLESSAGRNCYRNSCHGWAGGYIGADSVREDIERVGQTLKKYEERGFVGSGEKLSIWRTGKTGDQSGYPEKGLAIIETISRL